MSCTLVCRKRVRHKDDWSFTMSIRDALKDYQFLSRDSIDFLRGMSVTASQHDKRALLEMIEFLLADENNEIALHLEC